MNRLNLQGGGHPFVIEDVLFLQDAYMIGFRAALSIFKSNICKSFFLTGLEKADAGNGFVNISEGYVFHENEVFFCPGATDLPDSDICLKLHIDYQSPTPITLASGASVNTKQIREMRLANESVLPGDAIYYNDLASFQQLLKAKSSGWQDVSNFENGVSSASPLARYIRTVSGTVHLSGKVSVDMGTVTASSSQKQLFNLPNDFRSEQITHSFVSAGNGSSNDKLVRLFVNDSGNVFLGTIGNLSFQDAGFNLSSQIIVDLSVVNYIAK